MRLVKFMAHLVERAFFSHDPVHLENIISPLQKRSSHVRFNTTVVGFNKDGADVEQDAGRNAKCKHDGRHPSTVNSHCSDDCGTGTRAIIFSPAQNLLLNCRTCVELVVELVGFYVELVIYIRRNWNH